MNATIEVQMRDPRSINHMDPDTKLVHTRLEEWARWARDPGVLGFPRQSPTEKAALYGKLGIPQESNYKPEAEMPEQVARIDAAVAGLGDIDRRVVHTYYLRWEPVNVMARRHHMRVLQFQRVLRRARWRIIGYLAAAEALKI